MYTQLISHSLSEPYQSESIDQASQEPLQEYSLFVLYYLQYKYLRVHRD